MRSWVELWTQLCVSQERMRDTQPFSDIRSTSASWSICNSSGLVSKETLGKEWQSIIFSDSLLIIRFTLSGPLVAWRLLSRRRSCLKLPRICAPCHLCSNATQKSYRCLLIIPQFCSRRSSISSIDIHTVSCPSPSSLSRTTLPLRTLRSFW